LTKVFVAVHPTEAHLVAALLRSQGIEAEVRGEALFAVRGEVPVSPSTLPTVWVRHEQAAEALELVNERAVPLDADRPWTCSRCGQTVDPQFSACWNCGADVISREAS
jgi:hypothetical protein